MHYLRIEKNVEAGRSADIKVKLTLEASIPIPHELEQDKSFSKELEEEMRVYHEPIIAMLAHLISGIECELFSPYPETGIKSLQILNRHIRTAATELREGNDTEFLKIYG